MLWKMLIEFDQTNPDKLINGLLFLFVKPCIGTPTNLNALFMLQVSTIVLVLILQVSSFAYYQVTLKTRRF